MKKKSEDLIGKYSINIKDELFKNVLNKVLIEYKNKSVYPNSSLVFNAFNKCTYDSLKVVIIGQDPYSQKGYATGLAFANPKNTVEISPSLKLIKDRILKDFPIIEEGYTDLPFGDPYIVDNFDITLESWAKQGVLLLNSALTVEENKIGSHSKIWYPLIKEIIINLSNYNPGLIYLLFGKEARIFKSFINKRNNYIFEYNHPSYYARLNKEFDCDGFIKTNEILKRNNNLIINWNE